MHGILVESLSTNVNVPPQENKHQLGFTCARNLFCPNVEQKGTKRNNKAVCEAFALFCSYSDAYTAAMSIPQNGLSGAVAHKTQALRCTGTPSSPSSTFH